MPKLKPDDEIWLSGCLTPVNLFSPQTEHIPRWVMSEQAHQHIMAMQIKKTTFRAILDQKGKRSMSLIKKNSTFVVSYGDYDSYKIMAVFQTKKDVDLQQLFDEYLSAYPEEKEDYGFESEHFCEWLNQKPGLQLCRGVPEWHVADYGTPINPIQLGTLGWYGDEKKEG